MGRGGLDPAGVTKHLSQRADDRRVGRLPDGCRPRGTAILDDRALNGYGGQVCPPELCVGNRRTEPDGFPARQSVSRGASAPPATQQIRRRVGLKNKAVINYGNHMSVVTNGIQEKGREVRGESERNGQPFPPLYLPDPNPFSGHSYVLPSDN